MSFSFFIAFSASGSPEHVAGVTIRKNVAGKRQQTAVITLLITDHPPLKNQHGVTIATRKQTSIKKNTSE
jgi:hypothetical protein